MESSVGLVWLVVVLPFVGFLTNGLIAFLKPDAKQAVGAVGVSVLAGSFLVALAVVAGLASDPHGAPFVFTYWSWMPAGSLQIDLALQVDQLSAVMLMV